MIIRQSAGISSLTSEGVHWFKRNSTFSYSFSALPRYTLSSVSINGSNRAISGSTVVSESLFVYAIALPDTSATYRTSVDDVIGKMLTLSNPSSAIADWEQRVAASIVANDSLALQNIERARYSALLKMGPEAYFVAQPRIDAANNSETVSIASSGQASATGGGSLDVYFVPGVFNGIEGARTSATRLKEVLLSAGIEGSSSRYPRTVRFYYHQNPYVRLNTSSLTQCAKEFLWLYDVARGRTNPLRVVMERLRELLLQRRQQ